METWTQLWTPIVVECSTEKGTGKDRYRFWDSGRAIPAGAVRALIHINGVWEDMCFNTSWRVPHHRSAVGAWLRPHTAIAKDTKEKTISGAPNRARPQRPMA